MANGGWLVILRNGILIFEVQMIHSNMKNIVPSNPRSNHVPSVAKRFLLLGMCMRNTRQNTRVKVQQYNKDTLGVKTMAKIPQMVCEMCKSPECDGIIYRTTEPIKTYLEAKEKQIYRTCQTRNKIITKRGVPHIEIVHGHGCTSTFPAERERKD